MAPTKDNRKPNQRRFFSSKGWAGAPVAILGTAHT